MASTPYPRIVSAMSPVTPKPAAAFSTLAMTKSSDSRSMRAGIARRAISRPGLPKTSPTNRMRMRYVMGIRIRSPRRSGTRGSTTRSSPSFRIAAALPASKAPSSPIARANRPNARSAT